MKVLRSLLFILISSLCITATAQRPKAVQVFNVTEHISIFQSAGETMIDNKGVLWVGSDDKLISFDGFQYSSYELPAGRIPYSDHSQLQFNYQDRLGHYWAYINNNGLYKFDPSHKKFTPFPFKKDIEKAIKRTDMTGHFLLEDSKGRLWISLNGFGLLSVDEKTEEQKFYPIIDTFFAWDYISANWINCGVQTSDGRLFFGTNRGIITLDENDKPVQYLDTDPRFLEDVRCIITGMTINPDESKLIMCAWGTSMKSFDIKTKKFESYLTHEPDRSGRTNIINDLIRLTDSTYFFVKRDGTGDAGFGIFNMNDKSFRYLTGLEPSNIYREYFRIVPDGDFVWVSNVTQFYRFYLPALLDGSELTLHTLLPEKLKRDLHLYLSKFWVNEQQRVVPEDGFQLKNDENNLRFNFTCQGATMLDSILFSYRLKGYEKNWHSGYTTSIQYNNVPHGDYTLEIKMDKGPYAADVPELTFPFSIEARWWQTWWFRICAGMLLLGGVFFIYRQRIKSIKEKAELKNNYEKRIAEVEMKALRAQMNPHFIFNCLNSINRYIVKSDNVTASGYLTKFSKLIRHILDNSASGIIPLQTEIETLELYIQMEAMRFEDKFNYSITIDPALDTASTLIPSMLIQPYVENAIWHGLLHKKESDCLMQLSFRQNGPQLEVIVEDNGIGRARAAALKSKEATRSTSKGLQITHDRLELIKNLYGISATATITDLYGDTGQAAGTRVQITLPLLKTQVINTR